jgi:predicted nucleic-acid-binding Zn-ribbon protein
MKCFKCPKCKKKWYSSSIIEQCPGCSATLYPEDEVDVEVLPPYKKEGE